MGDQAAGANLKDPGRRSALGWLSSLALGGALVTAYGTFAGFIGRFLFPARPADYGWLFVRELRGLGEVETLLYRLPNGSPVNITRQDPETFIALSSTCPHLGCQVHWEPQNNRFFCPCHNGVFTPEGKGIGGPPGDAGQSLPQYPMKIEGGLLYIQVPLQVAALGDGRLEAPGPVRGADQDPCLCGDPGTDMDTTATGRIS